ncbi:double-strand break repair helicase AddA [Acidisoma cladoniae]|jgi:ATP-dependent helicase/nuclease subunit A|uniref:double-strand break repair helicase AddA n=1 Tax=Acidisoma cladoniae TaxID=3040935 RepID=UPI00254DD464|nr:double-strand break repair helicase AddA [Acidisoma sp. PAMC 29798]
MTTTAQPSLALPPTPSADDARVRASRHQMAASNPAVSTFVAASAGSGKTKLLTDRLLRLMLTGVDPGRILCLTFTRNAAAEMALRLQDRLGIWVSLPDEVLDRALHDLSVPPTPVNRKRARSLFAIVLDLPGGMRIDTIHAFCQSLLRRFPLEAGISPHFRLVEERDAMINLREEQEHMLARVHDGTEGMAGAVDALAAQIGTDDLDRLLRDIDGGRERSEHLLKQDLSSLIAAQRRVVGAKRTEAEIWTLAVEGADDTDLRYALGAVSERGAPGAKAKALALLDWLAGSPERRQETWQSWSDGLLTKGEPRSLTFLVGKKLDLAEPDIWPVIEAEQLRLMALNDAFAADRLATLSAAFLRLALPVLKAQARRRQVEGLMDYGDLILRSNDLLRDPGAAWVLFKLDHGLDHLLLDEVQDTAPGQWSIAGSLTEEFFAGAGTRDANEKTKRTVFAVGDRKQSIYGFQGADLLSFDAWRGKLRDRVRTAKREWHDGALDVSFRSVVPVLALVDAVFADPEAARGVVETAGEPLQHVSARPEDGGRVELWPLMPRQITPAPEPWLIPDTNLAQASAPSRLARALAQWIAQATTGGMMLESQGRPVTPGDILVLLQKRAPFAPLLVRELKAAGVAVAGLDRLELTAQAAVQDLMALADSLLLPEDDLAFACWLTSPLGNLTDDSLMALAAGRTQRHLFEALRLRAAERPDWQTAWTFFRALQPRVDYASPHALFSQALGALGGRARLFHRLGAEAAEPVDELLGAALTYGASHAPSLQGFLHWLRQSTTEAKREPGAAGDAVRIMTVHASKGLQAPIVIMADAAGRPPPSRGNLLWMRNEADGSDLPIFCPRRDMHCEESLSFQSQMQVRAVEEHHRLLYVAMTRAEDRLLVCGWETGTRGTAPTWHDLIGRGFDRLEIAPEEMAAGAWPETIRSLSAPQRRPPPMSKAETTSLVVAPMPPWLGQAPEWRASPPPPEPARPKPLAPSRPDQAAFGPVPQADSPVAARTFGQAARGARFARGTLIHGLLQHLPDIAPMRRAEAGRGFLTRPGSALDAAEAKRVLAQCLAVLDHPSLGQAFAPGSRAEVPLAGEAGGVVITGIVDRLAVSDQQVVAIDFKTGRQPPAEIGETPILYLRQMAAYRALLRAIFPGRAVLCALVWTETATVTPLPDAMLDGYAPGSTS